MALIEGVRSKAFHLREYLARGFCVYSSAHAAVYGDVSVFVSHAVYEYLTLTLHYILFLFAHCAANDVCASEAVARKLAENLHNLLLIDYTAVGYVEDVF